jgi:hypothetical protein
MSIEIWTILLGILGTLFITLFTVTVGAILRGGARLTKIETQIAHIKTNGISHIEAAHLACLAKREEAEARFQKALSEILTELATIKERLKSKTRKKGGG